MPDELVVDITDLGIGDAVRVNDLNEEHEDLEFLDPQSVVVTVEVTRLAKSEAALEEEEEEGEGVEGEGVEGEGGEEAATEEKTKE
jgi:large subunit ribosomal protein L25